MKTSLLKYVAMTAVLLFCSAYASAQAEEDTIYEKAEVDTPPRLLRQPKPEAAGVCKSNSQGTVIIEVVLHKTKKISFLRQIKSSGCEAYDQNAVDAAKNTQFEPGIKAGKPVSVKMQMRFTFTTY